MIMIVKSYPRTQKYLKLLLHNAFERVVIDFIGFYYWKQ